MKRRQVLWLVGVLALLAPVSALALPEHALNDRASATPIVSATQISNKQCQHSMLPVSLGAGKPVNQEVSVQLCLPAGKTPKTVQLLVHGCLYNGSYWEMSDPGSNSEQYNYVDHALKAGYATLIFDMVGTGASTHPISTDLTVPAGVWVIHELVQALRKGTISGTKHKVAFSRVIEVSHSFGTFFSWLEVSEYNDVNAAIFTGATHHLRVALPFLSALLSFEPSGADPAFAKDHLDGGYLTQNPSKRSVFYKPADANPAVIAEDADHDDLLTISEFADFPTILDGTNLNIRVPVLLVLGQDDPMFCAPHATDCSSAAALAAQERPYLGKHVPSLTAYLLPGAGHALNGMPNATEWFNFAQRWASRTVPAR
jgi:pimeloyl-ACP methyl ester carboxylesterase